MSSLFHNLLAQPGRVNVPYASYTPTFTGFSTDPIVQARYYVLNGMCHLWITTLTNGVSNNTSASATTFTLPFTSANTVGQHAQADVIVSNTRQAAKGYVGIAANSNTATVYVDFSQTTAWAANGTDKSFNLTLAYEVTGSTSYVAWTPSWGGFSANPTVTARYIDLGGGLVHCYLTATGHGTSNNTGASATTFTLPFNSVAGTSQGVQGSGGTASTRQSVPFTVSIAANSNVATVFRDGTLATAWNGSGNKSFNLSFFYEKTGSSFSTWTPAFRQFSTDPTVVARYIAIGKLVFCRMTATAHGTSNGTAANGLQFTLPFSSNLTFIQNTAGNRVRDNSANQSVLSEITIAPETNVGIMWKDATTSTAWTGSNEKSFTTSFIYEADNTIPFEVNDSPGNARPAIITWGQSNLGTGITTVASDLEAPYKQTYNQVRFYKYNTPYNYAAATHYLQTCEFLPMDYRDNRSYQTPDQNGTYSLQFYLYPECQTRVARNLYVVHHGEGNTGLAVEWKPTATIGDNYRELLFKIKATNNRILDADGIAPDFKFMLIVHGEYDSRNSGFASAYETNLTNFINGVRAISGLSSLPVIIVRLNTEMITAPVNPGTFGATIQTAQDNVVAALTNCYIVNPDGCQMQSDKTHYTVQGEHDLTDLILNVIDTNSLMS
jgi:carbohydrate esterase-like sialic acid-specific acetylesterase